MSRIAEPTRQWLAVFSVALSATVFCTGEFVPIGLLRYISAAFNVTDGASGLMVTAPGILAAFSAPFLTVVVGRMCRRRVLLTLGLLLLVSNTLATFAPNFVVLIAARVLFGVAIGGFWAIGAGVGGRLVAAESVPRATALIFAGVSGGMLVGGFAGALIGELLNWRAAFGFTMALSGVALLAQWLWLPPLTVDDGVHASDLAHILSSKSGRMGLFSMLLLLCGQFSTYTYITPFLANVTHFNGTEISAILLGYTLIGLVGNFIAGAFATKNVKVSLALTILILATSILCLPAAGPFKVLTLLFLAVWGTAYGAIPLLLQLYMAKASEAAPEGGMAMFVANFQTSIALGSFLGGTALDHFGILDTLHAGGLAALASAAALALTSVGERHRVIETVC